MALKAIADKMRLPIYIHHDGFMNCTIQLVYLSVSSFVEELLVSLVELVCEWMCGTGKDGYTE